MNVLTLTARELGRLLRGRLTWLVLGLTALVLSRQFRREQREREQQRAEKILNTPLEKFGDQAVEDLADKYEDTENKS